jgi:hypothetical protein
MAGLYGKAVTNINNQYGWDLYAERTNRSHWADPFNNGLYSGGGGHGANQRFWDNIISGIQKNVVTRYHMNPRTGKYTHITYEIGFNALIYQNIRPDKIDLSCSRDEIYERALEWAVYIKKYADVEDIFISDIVRDIPATKTSNYIKVLGDLDGVNYERIYDSNDDYVDIGYVRGYHNDRNPLNKIEGVWPKNDVISITFHGSSRQNPGNPPTIFFLNFSSHEFYQRVVDHIKDPSPKIAIDGSSSESIKIPIINND